MWSSILEIFSHVNTHHSLYICCLDFHMKKKFSPSNSNKILWSNKFLKITLVEIILFENQDGIYFLWDLGLQTLTMWPAHFFPLAYYRPNCLISIQFRIIGNNPCIPLKKAFPPFQLLQSCNPWDHFHWDFFLHTIGIVRYMILRLKVEIYIKSFLSLSYMKISTYLTLSIHQYSPKNLGVNA
jgi:hypothetical protein